VIRKVLAGIKRHRLFVYLFVAVAILGVAVSSTLTSDPNTTMTATSTTAVSDDKVAADYYNISISEVLQGDSTNEGMLPAATSDDYDSVPELEEALEDGESGLQGLSYFAFARWSTVTLLPVPAVGFANIGSLVVAAFVSLANLMFTVGAIIMLAIGLLLLLIVSINVLSAFMPTIDWFFASLTGQWLFGGGGTDAIFSGASPFFVAVALFVIAIFVRLSPLARKDGSLLGDLLISGFAIAALMLVSTNSAKNWDNSGTYAVDELNGEEDTIPFGKGTESDVDTADHDSYAPWSFGFMLTIASDTVDNVTTFAGGLISSITNSIGSVATSGSASTADGSDCALYVDNGMHSLATTMLTNGVFGDQSVNSVIAFDSLVYTILYKPAADASYGSTPSGSMTWCRMWESARGSDSVEQALISREADMYGYALDDGVYLDGNGDYVDGVDKNALSGFFGTNLATAKGTTAFKFFWAACEFSTGGSIHINDAWKKTLTPEEKSDDKPDGGKGDEITEEMCENVLTANDGSGGWAFGAKNDGGDAMKKLSHFAWTQDDEVFTLFFIGFSVPADISEQLSNSDVEGTEAIDFFKMVYGSTAGMVWPAAIVAVVGTVMMSIGLLPMQIGALILQMISVLALIAMPLILLVLILPIRAGRRAFFTVAKLFISAKLVQLIFVVFIAIALALINMMNIAFDSVLNSTLGNVSAFTGDGTPLGTFVTAILHAVSIGIAFFGTKKLLRDVFKADVTTIRGAMSVGQNMSSAALNGAPLREMGFGQLKGMRPTPGFGNADIPGLSPNTGDNEPRQPEIPQRDSNKEKQEDPKTSAEDVAKQAAETAAGIAATTNAPTTPPGSALEVSPDKAMPVGGTIGDGMATEEGPNGKNPEAPVPTDAMLSEAQRQEAAEKTESIRNAAGVSAEDVDGFIAERDISDLEGGLDYGIQSGDEQAVRDNVDAIGASEQLEGTASNTESNEAARQQFFDNGVTNEELPSDRGDNAGEANVKAVTLDRVQGDAGGIGTVDNNSARADNLRSAIGSEFEAPGMVEDNSTSGAGDGGFGAEGLTRRMDNLPGEVGGAVSSVMEGAFERFDALGRSIADSAEMQSSAIRDASSTQVRATEQQTEKLDNLQQTIAAWFPNRGK